MNKSILGRLARNFTVSPENLATEALSYLIGNSARARSFFTQYVSSGIYEINEDIIFSTQVHSAEDSTIPDLIGRNISGEEVLMFEAKSWASLTENQPVEYLKRLKKGILLFIVPQVRVNILWNELLRRCNDAKIECTDTKPINNNFRAVRVGTDKCMMITDWPSLLGALLVNGASLETETVEDIKQLLGLCNEMDTEAFLPLNSDELNSTFGRRICQFTEILDDLTNMLVVKLNMSLEGLRASATATFYVRYIAYNEFRLTLQVNYLNWSKYRETPFWVGIKIADPVRWQYPESLHHKLLPLSLESPSRYIETKDGWFIPLFAPLQKEKTEVVSALYRQIEEILNRL